MLPVAVDVAPPTAPREQVVTLLAACSRAVAEAQCLPAAEVTQGQTQAVAIVTWRGDESVRVEVGLRAEGKPVWRTRNLTFNPDDAVIERWRAVGYVVGTLARDERPADEPEPAPAADPEPKAPIVPPAAPKPAPATVDTPAKNASSAPRGGPARAAIDVGAVFGPSWNGLRSGGVLRTRWPLPEPLRVLASVRYLARPSDETGLSGRWLTLGAGVAGVLGTDQFEASAGLELRGEYSEARVEDALGRSGSDGGVLPGLGLYLGGAFMPTPVVGVYLGGDAELMFAKTTILVGSQPAGVDRALRFSADAGVRLKLW